MSKNKKIIIAVIAIILAGIGYLYYQSNTISEKEAERDQVCIDSGGIVVTGWCWRSGKSFPNTCLIGTCDCPPGFLNHLLYGRKVKFCNCGPEKCFDGEKCILFSEVMADDEASTRLQRDEKLGYEMEYPSTWSITNERKDFGIELSRTKFRSEDYLETESEEYAEIVADGGETGLLQPTVMSKGVSLTLLITKIPTDFRWQDWAERATDYPYGKIASQGFIALAGREVYKRQVNSGETTSIVISFPDPKETKLFELILHTLKKDEDKNSEILKQIISTFNF